MTTDELLKTVAENLPEYLHLSVEIYQEEALKYAAKIEDEWGELYSTFADQTELQAAVKGAVDGFTRASIPVSPEDQTAWNNLRRLALE